MPFQNDFFQRREERLIQYSTGVRSLKWAVSWTFDWSVTFFFFLAREFHPSR